MAYGRKKYNKRYGRKKYGGKKKISKPLATAVKKIVKRQMAKVIESKIGDYSLEPIPAAALYHNSPVILDNNMLYMQQGIKDEELSSSFNRIGDAVYSKYIQLSLLLTNFSTRPNLLYRISVIKVANGATTFPSGSIIYGHPQCGNMMIAPIDLELPGLVSVVYDRVLTHTAYQTASSGDADKKQIWRYTVKTNHKVKYDNGSSDPSTCTYRMVLTAYDTQATLTTSNVARYTYFRRHHFTDA